MLIRLKHDEGSRVMLVGASADALQVSRLIPDIRARVGNLSAGYQQPPAAW
jgi:hypothetical protein